MWGIIGIIFGGILLVVFFLGFICFITRQSYNLASRCFNCEQQMEEEEISGNKIKLTCRQCGYTKEWPPAQFIDNLTRIYNF
ncbi:MAG: hypothetical protein PHT40_02840 [Patescibacteria group bacterium]|nr:hypothetical protein [Patescibacteria group bacterium]